MKLWDLTTSTVRPEPADSGLILVRRLGLVTNHVLIVVVRTSTSSIITTSATVTTSATLIIATTIVEIASLIVILTIVITSLTTPEIQTTIVTL